jgi:riboflavin-specific deaminase-like protein
VLKPSNYHYYFLQPQPQQQQQQQQKHRMRSCKKMQAYLILLVVASTLSFAVSSANHSKNKDPPRFLSHQQQSREKILSILSQIRTWHELAASPSKSRGRPFVLASFAQSLDGQMAPWSDKNPNELAAINITTVGNYPLSGPDSLLLTHALRSIHDGILVGGKTLEIDNPRLTNRLWKNHDHHDNDNNETAAAAAEGEDKMPMIYRQHQQPIPIALDTRLNHITSLCLRKQQGGGGGGGGLRARNLVVCCGEDTKTTTNELAVKQISATTQLLRCKLKGGKNDQELDMLDVLQRLRSDLGIRTLMVEGGAQVLSSLFREGLVDAVCITIAPKALCGGVSPMMGSSHPIDLGPFDPVFRTLGRDCILLSRWPAAATKQCY